MYKNSFNKFLSRFGGKTLLGDVMKKSMEKIVNSRNRNDKRKGVIILISDGFFGDLENVQISSAECCAQGITTLSIAYESNNAILVRETFTNC